MYLAFLIVYISPDPTLVYKRTHAHTHEHTHAHTHAHTHTHTCWNAGTVDCNYMISKCSIDI